jgi:histone H3/H4
MPNDRKSTTQITQIESKNPEISNGSIRKLATTANILKLANNSYAEIKKIIEEYLVKIIGYAIVLMEHANRKTILISDIKQAIELLNYRRKQRRVSISSKFNSIPLHSFSNIVKIISKQKTKSKNVPRIADEAIHYLKSFIETQIVKIMKNVKKNLKLVQAEDIRLAYSYHC